MRLAQASVNLPPACMRRLTAYHYAFADFGLSGAAPGQSTRACDRMAVDLYLALGLAEVLRLRLGMFYLPKLRHVHRHEFLFAPAIGFQVLARCAKLAHRSVCATAVAETLEDTMPDSVAASHILLMYSGSARSTATRSKEEAQQMISDLHTQVQAGEDFAQLAQNHSDCPSGSQGGELGTFGPGQMVPAFEKAAFGLPVGGVSDVIETDFGFHLIKRTA
ncbi:MAG: peptidylprolyl isomerase [Polyangiales bacterium]